MKTRICRVCGCSLVRLGISHQEAVRARHEGQEHFFCCRGCAELFMSEPAKYLAETGDLIVCPTCLAEKPTSRAVELNIAGQQVHFCRCPCCAELFAKDPEYYIKRLEGTFPSDGVLGHDGCCVRPA